jgi:hypothetical protein
LIRIKGAIELLTPPHREAAASPAPLGSRCACLALF